MSTLMFLLNNPVPVYATLSLIVVGLLVFGFWPDRDGDDQ